MRTSLLGSFVIASTLLACSHAEPADQSASSDVTESSLCKVQWQSVSQTATLADGVDSAAVTGDFDGDGVADVVVMRGTELNVLLGAKGTLMKPLPKAAVGYDVTKDGFDDTVALSALMTGDFNGDKHLDIVGQARFKAPDGSATERVVVLRGKGDGTFEAPTYVTSHTERMELDVGDLDKDGKSDLLIRSELGTIIAYGRPGPFEMEATDIPAASKAQSDARVGDVDGDGYPEILLLSYNGAAAGVTIYSNPDHKPDFAGHIVRSHFWDYAGDSSRAFVTDADADGRADIFLSGTQFQRVIDDKPLSKPIPYLSMQIERVADFDGDKKADAMLAGTTDSNGLTLACDVATQGAPTFAPVTIALPGVRAYGDFDGDGRDDVITFSGPKAGEMTIYYTRPLAAAPDPKPADPAKPAAPTDPTSSKPTETGDTTTKKDPSSSSSPSSSPSPAPSASSPPTNTATVTPTPTSVESGCNAAPGTSGAGGWLLALGLVLSSRLRRSARRNERA